MLIRDQLLHVAPIRHFRSVFQSQYAALCIITKEQWKFIYITSGSVQAQLFLLSVEEY